MKQFLESADLLQTIASETEKVGGEARRLVADLTDEQLNWKPGPDSWSIAQCLEHLAVTSEEFDQDFAKAIVRGREKRRASRAVWYRPTMLGGWLVKQLSPEAKKRMPAPKVFRPAKSSAIKEALERFLRQHEKFLSFVNDARGIDYNKTRLKSPVTPLMRYSLADAFVMRVVDGRRHLAQARRVRGTSGFPRNQ